MTEGNKIFLSNKRVLFISCCLWAGMLCTSLGFSQPVLTTVQTIAGLKVFKDYKKKNRYYYLPGDIKLAQDEEGRPEFQLVQMRYTGTNCFGNLGDNSFLNLLQFTVELETVNSDSLRKVKKQLKKNRTPSLYPFPIRTVESYLLIPTFSPLDSNLSFNRIEGQGNLEAGETGGNTSRDAYWSRRIFTVRLNNEESQLVWGQIEEGNLAFSMGYSFFADVIPTQPYAILEGDRETIEGIVDFIDFDELFDESDTTLTTVAVKSNAFSIYVDVEKWPETLLKVDVNEEAPPAYAPVEVRCYDFVDGLRPDLALKILKVEATAVNGNPVTISTEFKKKEPDLHTRNLRFPFAVRMDKALRYHIIEYTNAGEKIESEWMDADFCSGILDITTPANLSKVRTHNVVVEVNSDSMLTDSINKVVFSVSYSLAEKELKQQVTFQPTDEIPMKELSFRYDLADTVSYSVKWIYQNGLINSGAELPLQESFLFLNPPE